MIFRLSGSVFVGLLLAAGARAQSTDEYKVKAAFLYNFAKFVVWPPQSLKNPSDPIVIGVLGKDPFGGVLAATAAGKTLDGHPFQVRDVADALQAAACQILFISSSERKRLEPLFNQLGGLPVLTVGETDNFAAEGGVINFKIEGGTVRLQINVEAARRQQLHISAKLLSLAEVMGKAEVVGK